MNSLRTKSSILGGDKATSAVKAAATVFTVAALSTGVAACSAESGNDSAQGGAAGKDSDFQPVTIEHALGKVEIDEKPERVVTLGQGSTETAIALGVTPVAMEQYDWGADDSGYLPWIREAVEDKGDELPALIKGQDNLSPEEILKYEPDVILAPWSGLTQEQYDQLNKIAPTVAYEEQPWVIKWGDQIRTVSKALGKEDKAQGLIDDIQGELADAKEPEYEGKTFSYIYNSGPENLGIFFPDEQRVAMVRALGLTVDPVVEEFRKDEVPGTDSAQVSKENLDKLDNSDLIFTFYMDDENRKTMHKDPAYSRIPAIADGREVAYTDQSLVTASSMINPLTVPWATERMKPLIDEAVAKVNK